MEAKMEEKTMMELIEMKNVFDEDKTETKETEDKGFVGQEDSWI